MSKTFEQILKEQEEKFKNWKAFNPSIDTMYSEDKPYYDAAHEFADQSTQALREENERKDKLIERMKKELGFNEKIMASNNAMIHDYKNKIQSLEKENERKANEIVEFTQALNYHKNQVKELSTALREREAKHGKLTEVYNMALVDLTASEARVKELEEVVKMQLEALKSYEKLPHRIKELEGVFENLNNPEWIRSEAFKEYPVSIEIKDAGGAKHDANEYDRNVYASSIRILYKTLLSGTKQ